MNAIVPDVIVARHTPYATVRRQPVTTHTVRRGQTLSSIVRDHLKAAGLDHSRTRIYQAVDRVAKTNGLPNPDRIRIGQHIRLDGLVPKESEPTRVQESPTQPHREASTTTNTSTPVDPSRHPYHRVLNGPARLTSTFGTRVDPIAHDHRNHNGIDLAATRNTPITSMRPGVVTFSGWMRGYGHTIIVEHEGGLTTQYSHAAKRLVERGTPVNSSTVLGLVGSTGRATGPHLHFEVRRRDRQVNPIPYLMTEPVQPPRTRVSLSI